MSVEETPLYELSFNGAAFEMRLHLLTRDQAVAVMDALQFDGKLTHSLPGSTPSIRNVEVLHLDQHCTGEHQDGSPVLPAQRGPYARPIPEFYSGVVRSDFYATVADSLRSGSHASKRYASRSAALDLPYKRPSAARQPSAAEVANSMTLHDIEFILGMEANGSASVKPTDYNSGPSRTCTCRTLIEAGRCSHLCAQWGGGERAIGIDADGWMKSSKGNVKLYTHPKAFEGRTIVENHHGITFNGHNYLTVAAAKRDALRSAEHD